METLGVDVVGAESLGVSERDAWVAMVGANATLAHPYFDLRYTLAGAAEAPGARVAVLRQGRRIVGFLPFQRRGGVVQPLGAPLTDYHAVIAPPGTPIELQAVTPRLGGRLFRFTGLSAERPGVRWSARRRMAADLSGGWHAWMAGRQADRHRVFKNLRRAERALERDVGPVSFTLGERDPAVLDWILKLKRAQMARTGWPDIFGCGWTEALLRRLLACEDADFGARLAVLRAGDRMVSAEVGLHGAGVRHLWFPVFEPELGRYSPGQLMTLKTLQACAEAGIARVDFGPGAEGYKSTFADPAETVWEGSVVARPWRASASRALDVAQRLDPVRLQRWRTAVKRRLDVATACETAMGRRIGLLARTAPNPPPHPPTAAALGLIALGL